MLPRLQHTSQQSFTEGKGHSIQPTHAQLHQCKPDINISHTWKSNRSLNRTTPLHIVYNTHAYLTGHHHSLVASTHFCHSGQLHIRVVCTNNKTNIHQHDRMSYALGLGNLESKELLPIYYKLLPALEPYSQTRKQ